MVSQSLLINCFSVWRLCRLEKGSACQNVYDCGWWRMVWDNEQRWWGKILNKKFDVDRPYSLTWKMGYEINFLDRKSNFKFYSTFFSHNFVLVFNVILKIHEDHFKYSRKLMEIEMENLAVYSHHNSFTPKKRENFRYFFPEKTLQMPS